MNSRRATGADVARVAGVSKSAVSRAYTGGVVSDEARRRIMEAARILRYRPNASARSLITSRSRLLGLAITSLDNQFYPALVEQLHECAAAAGYRIVLFITHGEAGLDPVLEELMGYQLDGVILASSSLATRVARECIEAGVPVVMLNNIDPEGQISGVCADSEHGACAIADFLLAQGRRRLGLITGLSESSAAVERAFHFTRAVAEHPDARLLSACGHFTAEGAYQAARDLLERDDPADSLFCVTDFMAIFALQAVRDLGLTPGKDVAVLGFDDAPVASWSAFDLSTYASPLQEMVETTLELLQKQIDGEAAAGVVRLKGRLVIRGSGICRTP